MAYTFDKANANEPSRHETQYFEMVGNRALYHDGSIATTTPAEAPWLLGTGKFPDLMTGYNWELYNLTERLFRERRPLRQDESNQAQGTAGGCS